MYIILVYIHLILILLWQFCIWKGWKRKGCSRWPRTAKSFESVVSTFSTREVIHRAQVSSGKALNFTSESKSEIWEAFRDESWTFTSKSPSIFRNDEYKLVSRRVVYYKKDHVIANAQLWHQTPAKLRRCSSWITWLTYWLRSKSSVLLVSRNQK